MEITRDYVKSVLPRRDPEGHKGTFGKVYCLCGAVGYTGREHLLISHPRGYVGLSDLEVAAYQHRRL